MRACTAAAALLLWALGPAVVSAAPALRRAAPLRTDGAADISDGGEDTVRPQLQEMEMGRWPTPLPPPVVSITSVGGKGDNTTSNTAAFKAAVRRIEEAGGGTLLVPAGVYIACSSTAGI
jgi:hypothetical protein